MQKPNFDEMTREDAIKLLKKIRNALIGCEDCEGEILYISELLGVDQRVGAENDLS